MAYYPLPQLKDSLLNIKDFMRWIASDNDATYLDAGDGAKENFIQPTEFVFLLTKKML